MAVIVIEVTSTGLINSKVSVLEQSFPSVVVSIYKPLSSKDISSVIAPLLQSQEKGVSPKVDKLIKPVLSS